MTRIQKAIAIVAAVSLLAAIIIEVYGRIMYAHWKIEIPKGMR